MTDDKTDAEHLEDVLPAVDEMARADGADLDASGTEYRCDHPHHTTPSSHPTAGNLCIAQSGESWHCKRHDHGGGKLSWVAMSEGIVGCGDLNNGLIPRSLFPDVLEVAADRAGVELSDSPNTPDKATREKQEAFDADRRAIAGFYHACLDDHDMRAELQARYGLSDDLIDENLIGYAPPAGMDHDLPGETGISADRLKRLGVWRPSGAPHFQDRFVFPYFENDRGDRRVRYFTARAVEADGGPKYLKLKKGDAVDDLAAREPPFGMDTVRGSRTVIVAEGVTDALTLHDHGIAAVSPVTTHISGEAMERFATALRGKDVYVVYDNDAGTNAGIQGAARDAYSLYEKGVDARVAELPARPNESVDVNEWFMAYDANDDLPAAQAFREQVLSGTYPAKVAWYGYGNGHPHHLFGAAVEHLGENRKRFVEHQDDEGNPYYDSVKDVLQDAPPDRVDIARRKFYAANTLLRGSDHRECYEYVVSWYFRMHGEFFRVPETDKVMFHYEPPGRHERPRLVQASKVSNVGEAHAEFVRLIKEVFGSSIDKFAGTLKDNVVAKAAQHAPTRPTAKMFASNSDEGEVYVDAHDGTYFVMDGTGPPHETRRNGTDVFFLPVERAERLNYIPPEDRPSPEKVPGELHPFVGEGDLLQRFICNRVNYDEQANLAPMLQRSQLYLHLHILPFVGQFDAKPIMAWVGDKGSGKTVVMRSIGHLLYGSDWRETVMPSDEDDFVTMVSNNTFAAIDNYDDGVKWANDKLAALATGSGVEKRELYTTNDSRHIQPKCWLSLTSRTPPFRRDDVADRCLIFRVERVEDFVSESAYLGQVTENRDALWSAYMDNVDRIVAVRNARNDPNRTTSHRMADWALFAQDAAEALGVPEVDDLLEGMKTERAYFALENDPLRLIIESFLRENPDGGDWLSKDLLTEFDKAAEDAGVANRYSTSRGLSNALSSRSDELGELFGMEVIDPPNGSKKYRFPGSGQQGMLGYDFPGGDRRGDDDD